MSMSVNQIHVKMVQNVQIKQTAIYVRVCQVSLVLTVTLVSLLKNKYIQFKIPLDLLS